MIKKTAKKAMAGSSCLALYCGVVLVVFSLLKTAEWNLYISAMASASGSSLFWPNHGADYVPTKEESVTGVENFPSVEERVKLYMGVWYLPPCQGHEVVYRRLTRDTDDLLVYLNGQHDVSLNQTTFVMQYGIQMDAVFHMTSSLLDWCLANADKSTRFYCLDIKNTMLPLLPPGSLMQLNRIDITVPPVPWMMQFGDRPFSFGHDNRTLPLPIFKKYRPSLTATERERLTQDVTCRSSTTYTLDQLRYGPIIWKLNIKRHYGMLDQVALQDTPWTEKKPQAVFRGTLTGFAPSSLQSNDRLSDHELCMILPRCRLVYENQGNPHMNVKLVELWGRLSTNDTLNGVSLLDPRRLNMKEMMGYKMLILLQGNDVSSSLKWGLLSSSVVLMPPPTATSFAMEELLEPWVHYVPLRPDLSDVARKVAWVLDHDDWAQRIGQRATRWMHRFLNGTRAEQDNKAVQAEIVRRYPMQFLHAALV